MSSKPLQNGRHESLENGNVPVENPAELQQEREQPPPPPEPELVEAALLSPFSMPGEFGVGGAPGLHCWGLRGSNPGSSGWRVGPMRAGEAGGKGGH